MTSLIHAYFSSSSIVTLTDPRTLSASAPESILPSQQAKPSLISRSDYSLRQLAEHHRYKLAPAAETFGRFLPAAFSDPSLELMAIYHRK